MSPFHETNLGYRFFSQLVPEIAETLEGIHHEMKRANDLKERELHAQKPQDGVDAGAGGSASG